VYKLNWPLTARLILGAPYLNNPTNKIGSVT